MQPFIKKYSQRKVNDEWSEQGFVFVLAILGIAMLLALGTLALTMSGRDVTISSRVVGEKKALSACESGIHSMMLNFNPVNLAGSQTAEIQVNPAADPASRYTIDLPGRPDGGPGVIPLAGYSIGGGQMWGQTMYEVVVTGMNTAYNSRVQVGVGMGYGPVEFTTISR
jgi:hypothetical protein